MSRTERGPRGGAPTRRSFLALGVAASTLRLRAASSTEPDARQFLDVPNPYRMRMHWFIFGPAWTAEECERELQFMSAAHIGGVLIFPAYPIALDDQAHGIRNQKYLSPEFFEVLNAALRTCKKLGLTADLLVRTGWPYGGPSVSVADSAKCLRRASVPVTAQAPVPLPDIDEAGKLLAAFYVDPSGYARLPIEKGSSSLMPPATSGEVQFFYSRPTRMQVKRASLGAEGPVLDHYDAGALQRYLAAIGDKLLAGVPGGAIRSIFCDSLEAEAANWTDDPPAIFLRKRGYDLMAHLPALFDRNHADSRDLRADFWPHFPNRHSKVLSSHWRSGHMRRA